MHAHTVRPPNHACIDPLPWRRTRTVVRSGHSCMHAFERKARKGWMDTNDHRATTIDKCACSATVGAGVCDDWCAYASPSVSVLTGSDYRSDTFFFPYLTLQSAGLGGPQSVKTPARDGDSTERPAYGETPVHGHPAAVAVVVVADGDRGRMHLISHLRHRDSWWIHSYSWAWTELGRRKPEGASQVRRGASVPCVCIRKLYYMTLFSFQKSLFWDNVTFSFLFKNYYLIID
jgi:hypothetical protein